MLLLLKTNDSKHRNEQLQSVKNTYRVLKINNHVLMQKHLYPTNYKLVRF